MQVVLTLPQTVVFGDGWGCDFLPLIEGTPINCYLFVGCHGTVGVGLMDLVIKLTVHFTGVEA